MAGFFLPGVEISGYRIGGLMGEVKGWELMLKGLSARRWLITD